MYKLRSFSRERPFFLKWEKYCYLKVIFGKSWIFMKFFVPQILELYWSKPVYKLSVRIIDFHPSVWFYKKFDFIVFNSEIAFWAWNWVYTVLGIALVRRKNILEHPLWLFLSPFRLGVLILVWRPFISKVKFQYRLIVLTSDKWETSNLRFAF